MTAQIISSLTTLGVGSKIGIFIKNILDRNAEQKILKFGQQTISRSKKESLNSLVGKEQVRNYAKSQKVNTN